MSQRRVEQQDEDALVRRARTGDRAAFAELVRVHQHEVYTLALRLVADRELAADIAQEALIRAWRALPRFRGDAAFSTWLHRITVNTAWTLRRRTRRHQAAPLEAVESRAALLGAEQPEVAGEVRHLRAQLTNALAQLPSGHRAVVVLKDVYGWSHAEVAEALGISVAAAKVRLHRAHRRLQQLLWEERR